MSHVSKKKIPHAKTAKSDAEHLSNMGVAAEQFAAGHYHAKDIHVVQGEALPDGGVPISVQLTRYETNPSAPAAE